MALADLVGTRRIGLATAVLIRPQASAMAIASRIAAAAGRGRVRRGDVVAAPS
jgi:hypothetical protein